LDILQTKLIKPLLPLLFFTFLLTFFSVNYAQVKIKEKVEIKPLLKTKQRIPTVTNNGRHILKVESEWKKVYGPDVPDTAIFELFGNKTFGFYHTKI